MPIIFKKKKEKTGKMFSMEKGTACTGERRWQTAGATLKKTLSPLTLLGGQLRASYRAYKSWDYREWEEEQEPKLQLFSSFRIFILLFKKKKKGKYPPWTKGQNWQLPYPQARVYNPTPFELEQSCEDTQHGPAYTWLPR